MSPSHGPRDIRRAIFLCASMIRRPVARELIDQLVGKLSVQPYLAYLRTKFGEIYRL